AEMEALLDRWEAAEATMAALEEIVAEMGSALFDFEIGWVLGQAELRAGRLDAAEPHLRRAYERTTAMGEALAGLRLWLWLARCLVARGELAVAEQLVARVEAEAAPSDRLLQASWRGVKALVLVGCGETAAGVDLGREGVALADGSDWLLLQADARVDLAE